MREGRLTATETVSLCNGGWSGANLPGGEEHSALVRRSRAQPIRPAGSPRTRASPRTVSPCHVWLSEDVTAHDDCRTHRLVCGFAVGVWKRPVVTEIARASEFWTAEDYHQDYLQKNPGGYTCHWERPISFDKPATAAATAATKQ